MRTQHGNKHAKKIFSSIFLFVCCSSISTFAQDYNIHSNFGISSGYSNFKGFENLIDLTNTYSFEKIKSNGSNFHINSEVKFSGNGITISVGFHDANNVVKNTLNTLRIDYMRSMASIGYNRDLLIKQERKILSIGFNFFLANDKISFEFKDSITSLNQVLNGATNYYEQFNKNTIWGIAPVIRFDFKIKDFQNWFGVYAKYNFQFNNNIWRIDVPIRKIYLFEIGLRLSLDLFEDEKKFPQ
ncbi:hypothetical protein [Crocinitomix catalasitica]|uniref:hypothetical protein n=1 Tax=Crocinitomix catalasitica TaxID=184607 RepID=UPI00048297E5|nr:hypothetical protein [Crocinitomix catalasitica]